MNIAKIIFFGILSIGLGAASYFKYPAEGWEWFLVGAILVAGILYDVGSE